MMGEEKSKSLLGDNQNKAKKEATEEKVPAAKKEATEEKVPAAKKTPAAKKKEGDA
jgi:hypothetical protein